MSCKRCQADPQPSYLRDPRRCAFTAEGAFTPDNWQCATLEVLLDKAQANHYGNDESVQLVPVVFFDENGLADGTNGWIVLTRYKSRNCTSSAIHVGDFWPPEPVTLAMAEQQADFHESDQREIERLREALRKLVNTSELLALAHLPPDGVNSRVLQVRINEARAVLAAKEATGPLHPEQVQAIRERLEEVQRYRSGAYGAMVEDDDGPYVCWRDVQDALKGGAR